MVDMIDSFSVNGRIVRCISSKNESVYKPKEIYRVFQPMLGDHFCIQSEEGKKSKILPFSGMTVKQALEVAEFEILN